MPSYTSIPTNVLFFDRSRPTREVWYYEHPLPEGRKNYTKTQPLQFEEFAPLIAWWNKRAETDRAWKVPAAELLAAGCNLDRKNPRAKQDITHLPSEELAASILEKEQRIAPIMGNIQKLLRNKWCMRHLVRTLKAFQEIGPGLGCRDNPTGCQTVAGGRSRAETSGLGARVRWHSGGVPERQRRVRSSTTPPGSGHGLARFPGVALRATPGYGLASRRDAPNQRISHPNNSAAPAP